jgi:hypothetical protein
VEVLGEICFPVTVLLGLIECEERRTMTGFLRVVGERISLSGLSRFLSKWLWSIQQVTETWMNRIRQQMKPLVHAEHTRLKSERLKSIARPRATLVTGYLILDDSVHTKPKGKKMGGLGRHFSKTEQKVVPGHCLMTGLYVLLDRRCPFSLSCIASVRFVHRKENPFRAKSIWP